MANAYTQIHIHAVFAVKYRQSLIPETISKRLYEYMGGIINTEDQQSILINGMPDHVHLAFRIKPSMKISDLMRVVKTNSSRWLNKQHVIPQPFAWQRGYGAFAVEATRIEQVIYYIKNQQSHHQKHSFKEEYLELLNTHRVEFDEEYLFEWIGE